MYTAKIEGSAVANAIRWNIYGTGDVDTIKAKFGADVDYVKNFAITRAAFLTNNFGAIQVQENQFDFFDKIRMGICTSINDTFEGFIKAFRLYNVL